MANHSATKKAIRKTVKKTAINKNKKSRIKTFIKRVVTAVAAGSSEEANKALIEAQVEIMKGVSAKLIKKNTASRKVSRLAKSVKNLATGTGNSADAKPVGSIKTEKAKAAVKSTAKKPAIGKKTATPAAKKSATITAEATPKKETAAKKKAPVAKK
jgi:small subunit ribosomal protein S20